MSDSGFPLELAYTFAEIDRSLVMCSSTQEVCALLTSSAVRLVPGAEFAGITELFRGRFLTRAATAQLVNGVDAIQYELGSGPCIDATSGGQTVRTNDLDADERWPVFGPRAVAKTPVRSMLSLSIVPRELAQPTLGLNLYATTVAAFTDAAQALATVLAAQAAIAVVAAEAREHAEQLEAALANSREIGIAIGVMMRAHSITRDAAFELLRAASQQTHRKLADIARDVGDTGVVGAPGPKTK